LKCLHIENWKLECLNIENKKLKCLNTKNWNVQSKHVVHMDKKHYNIVYSHKHPTRLLFILNPQSQSKAKIYSDMGCYTYKLTGYVNSNNKMCSSHDNTYRLKGYVNSNTRMMFRSWQIVVFGYHKIQDFQKKNDCLTNFYHIQVGPHGFIITNKPKWGLENLEINNKKSRYYRDHCWTIIDINTYRIRFARNQ
jgi:hypothetical protein